MAIPKNTLTVTIFGGQGAGKTTAAGIITEALINAGYTVAFFEGGELDGVSEGKPDKRSVVVKTVQDGAPKTLPVSQARTVLPDVRKAGAR